MGPRPRPNPRQPCILPSLLVAPVLILLVLLSCSSYVESSALTRALNNTVSALFVFGDSTSDPGNNNYVSTIFKGNFLPYGQDFADHRPTGRFTNGRLASDYIISYTGIKDYVPPYLDPSLSIEELMTGVSFASAGSGFDPLTPSLSNVVSLPKQLEYFKEYKERIASAAGEQEMERLMSKAVFLLSAGTNDFVVNYFTVPIRRRSFTVFAYQQFLMQQIKDIIQGLWDEGARRIAVVGLPPMGCLPIMITLNSDHAITQRGCMDQYSSVARDYNSLLQAELGIMQNGLASRGARIYYADIYQPLLDMIQRSDAYGFDEASTGCCGTGLLEAAFLCNPKSYVCSDASKYVFWDSIHPTEKTYYLIFQALLPVVDRVISDD
ncbi:hypothetical protein MLD38_039914 [Melastoma candidum]|uniref:Uncharacterized protein n=1 Tax=Melastoma candidum TaxID=119954 RepID=A0ACB9L515_9MYRT|nr:hypothetical protein MLD38_039914 [Melastoma candidum]